MKKNILLIGFMGVGKGRTARALAAETGMYAVDCDDLIESMANMKIKQIFTSRGEAHFRKLERDTAKWLEKSVDATVISCGGGFYKVGNLHRIGKVVYLHADFAEIVEGIKTAPNADKKIRKRPLLEDMDKAEALFAERAPLYRKIADLEVAVSGRTPEQVATEIRKRLGRKKK